MEEVRTHEQGIEFRDSAVEAERGIPGAREWDRHKLYNAANLYYFRTAWDSERQRKYKVARVGGCVMYDADRLRDVGAFNFWKHPPPEYSGEDVLAQLHLLKRYGGFGIIPSGVYHQELPAPVQDRWFDLTKLVYSKGIKPRSLYGRDCSAAG